MIDRFEIKPREGMAPVLFGMTPTNVESILGIKQHYETWMDCNTYDSLLYSGVKLSFDKYNMDAPLPESHLCQIQINPETFLHTLLLFGKPVSEWNKWELYAYMERFESPRELGGKTGEIEGFFWEQLHFEVDFDECDRVNFIDFW